MKKITLAGIVALLACLVLIGCSAGDTDTAATSTTVEEVAAEPTPSPTPYDHSAELGEYIGTVEEYQTTLDTMFDADGYRVIQVGENSDIGIVDAKYGVIDSYGNFVVEPIYDDIVWEYWTSGATQGSDVLPSVFYGGYLQVIKDGKMGLVNMQGELVIPCEYSTVAMPSEGICTLYNTIEGTELYESNAAYVGYWNLALGCEILAPDTYYCCLENAPIGAINPSYGFEDEDYGIKPEGDYYCFNDFIGGYAMVVTDPSYVISSNVRLISGLNMDYVNIIDTNGNFIYDQSYLVIWYTGEGVFSVYPQKGEYLAFWELTDYSAFRINGQSLQYTSVYEVGVMCASGVLLEAKYTSGTTLEAGIDYNIQPTAPQIDLETGTIVLKENTTPYVVSDGEILAFTLSGAPTDFPTATVTPQSYTIFSENDLAGVMAADGTVTVSCQYDYILEGVAGSTWYICKGTNGLFGLVDITTGVEILPCEYDTVGLRALDGQENINQFEMGVCYVVKGENEYLVDETNTIVADVTGLRIKEAVNGLYPRSANDGYVDNRGRIVLPGYVDTRDEDDPYCTYTLYQKNGYVYLVSANALV